jgi:hypothetical protein
MKNLLFNVKRIALINDIMITKRGILLHIQPVMIPYLIKVNRFIRPLKLEKI